MIWYNMGSLCFGFLAWLLPAAAILGRRRLPRNVCHGLTAASFAFCALALWLQLLEFGRKVELADWSALMDTHAAAASVGAALLAAALVLNSSVWLVCRVAGTRGV